MARTRYLLSAALWLCGSPAVAQSVLTSAAPDSVGVTIYRAPDRDADQAMELDWLEGYALVTEQRTVTIPAGRATVRFEGVAGGMLPESAIITGLPSGVREKNLDADLLSSKSLYARSFGRPVILRRAHGKTGAVTEERAIIRSGPDGAVIVQTKDGFEAADCGPLNDTLVYHEVPQGLSARPTLSFETDSLTEARVTLSLSYLAWGFDWQANYVVHMREGGKGAELTAWVTLASSDSTSFVDAEAAVVGGKVNREDERGYDSRAEQELEFRCFFRAAEEAMPPPAPPPPMAMGYAVEEGDIIVTGMRREMKMMAAPITVVEEQLGDLKLYRVPVPTTVAANAQKQVALLDQRKVEMAIIYTSEVYGSSTNNVSQILRTRNRKEEGLGIALPSGQVAVFEPLDGQPMLIGEGSIADKAVGEDVEITLADATQVNIMSDDLAQGKGWEDVELTVTNANPWPVSFEAKIHPADGGKIERASARLTRKDGVPQWAAQVPANGTAKLRYRLRGN